MKFRPAFAPMFVAMFGAAPSVAGQVPPASVTVHPTPIFSFPAASEEAAVRDIAGSPMGKLVYYVADDAVRVYDRASKASRDVLKGRYNLIATSPKGDRLVLLRPAEDAKPDDRNPMTFMWTVAVNSATGAAIGEPRRVSDVPAESPSFSPDGQQMAFIAKGNPRKMMVMPAAGGPERVLFERGGPRGPVEWSPDGRWVYFAQPSGQRDAPWMMSRVSADGGTPTPVTPPLRSPFGGLSPDGKYVVGITREIGTTVVLGIFDAEKKLVGQATVPLSQDGEPYGLAWAGDGLRLTVAIGEAPGSLHLRSIAGNADRVIPMQGLGYLRSPHLSPDGQRLAFIGPGDTSYWAATIANADGSGRRLLRAVGVGDLEGITWSPDSRYVSFSGDERHVWYVADAATSQLTRSDRADVFVMWPMWREDSRSILYGRADGTPADEKIFMRELRVGGEDRLVRDISADLPSGGATWYGNSWALNDSEALAWKLGLVVSLKGGPPRKLYESIASEPRREVVVSADRRWVALPAADRKSIDIIATDDQSRRNIRLPREMTCSNLPNGQPSGGPLLLTTAATATAGESILALPIDGGAPRTVLALKPGETFNDISIAADGGSVLYVQLGPMSMNFVDIDLAPALRARGKP
jgi:Tol biopolymer transport system component